jgi:hypothetical protein
LHCKLSVESLVFGGSRSLLPRIDHSYPHGLKVAHIPGYNRHAMDERRGCNEGIVIRARIRNVEGCATLSHSSINRKYAAGERR